jgi:heat shock protein HslJ
MREPWVNELLADAPTALPGFREQLRSRVLDAWRGRELVDVTEREGRTRRRWPLLVAGAALALLVTGLVAVAMSDRATDPVPSDTAPESGAELTPEDVVGVWVITERSNVPLPSPLPTYRFTADGQASGFDGCNVVSTTWSIEDGRLRMGDTGEATGFCRFSDGREVPTVPPGGAHFDSDTTTMLLEDDGSTAVARRVGDLEHPRTVFKTNWILGVDGPDLAFRFDDQLLVRVDGLADCGRTTYMYRDGVLRLGRFEGADASCDASQLRDLEEMRSAVFEYTDAYSSSILVVGPTGGAIRLFPGSVESIEATPPSQVTVIDLDGRTFLINDLLGEAETLEVFADPTITFDGDQLSLFAGCNTFTTPNGYRLADGRLVIAGVEMTALPCVPDARYRRQEGLFQRLLQGSPTVTLDGARLTLNSGDVLVTAVDSAASRPPDNLATTELDPTVAETAEAVVRQFLEYLRSDKLDQAAALWSGYPGDPGEIPATLEQFRVDFRWLLSSPSNDMHVTPSFSWSVPVPVVTVVSDPSSGPPRRAAAFVVGTEPDGYSPPDRIHIHRLPGAPVAAPMPGTTISPGDRIVIAGVPTEGGATAHINGDEVPIAVNYDRVTTTVKVPATAVGEIVLTVSFATAEIPEANALWYAVADD